MRLSVNISPCPNDTFMFEAMLCGRIDTEGLEFDVRFADIEQLNGIAINGAAVLGCVQSESVSCDADICKVSYAILPLVTDRYALLRCGSALGRGNGPLLVGREDADVAHLSRVAIPGLHTTANLLMNRIFPHVTDKPCYVFSEIADSVLKGECDAGVLIHEGRFTYKDKGLKLIADLGLEWEMMTGLPLPLGAIVVSRSLPEDVRAKVERVLRRSIEYAFANPDASADFVRKYAQEMSADVTCQHIKMFVNDYSLSLAADGEQAVRELTGLNEDLF